MPSVQSIKSAGGATFYVACGAVAAMAMAQVAVVIWGWQKREENSSPANVRARPRVESLEKIQPTQPPAPVVETPLVTPVKQTIRIAEKKPMQATLDVPIMDETILNHLSAGLDARESGDMQTALTEFRAAWLLQPDHPKLIYQLAQTLDRMGLEHKSQSHWNTLVSLGHAAGDYFDLAEMHVKNRGEKTPGPAETEEREGRLKLSDLKLENVSSLQGGQKKLLSFTIKKSKIESIKSNDIAVAIHFFDLVNQRRIDRTTAAPPAPVMVSTLEDWEQHGVQRLEVLYDQAEMTPADIIALGHRKYYGYVLELYLKDSATEGSIDRLQDLVAEPPELANFAREMPVESPRKDPNNQPHPLIPQNAADASLFPQ